MSNKDNMDKKQKTNEKQNKETKEKYDELFNEKPKQESVFKDKNQLNPLKEPDKIISREKQEKQLANILNSIHEGYLPPTISIYGPPGTGKTVTIRKITKEFTQRNQNVEYVYVNLKESRSLFSAANEIHLELSGEKKKKHHGLDGIFKSIWETLETYPEYTILILDEIDQIRHDRNYDTNDFFYRLIRGEGKLKRNINLSLFLISNELLRVDLKLDSRVKSAMGGKEIFFPPYKIEELREILKPRLDKAFKDKCLPENVQKYGIRISGTKWGDIRKTLTLFRNAGETANKKQLNKITKECIDENIETTDKQATIDKVMSLPFNHFRVLVGITGYKNTKTKKVIQPIETKKIKEGIEKFQVPENLELGDRALREILTDLETMGLIETWIESKGNEGRTKKIKTTFNPEWIQQSINKYIKQSKQIDIKNNQKQ